MGRRHPRARQCDRQGRSTARVRRPGENGWIVLIDLHDGGALLTADLRIGVHDVSLAIGHVAFDEFTDDARTSGIDAAVQALGLIAHRVNQAVIEVLQATAAPPASQFAA